jgi:hypothetical protein
VNQFRAAAFFALALLLCGCSDADWNNVLSFNTAQPSDSTTQQAAPPQAYAELAPPVAHTELAAPEPSSTVTQTVTTVTRLNPAVSYCRQVARGSGAVATRDGDDGAEQQHAADATYQECLRLYGATDP